MRNLLLLLLLTWSPVCLGAASTLQIFAMQNHASSVSASVIDVSWLKYLTTFWSSRTAHAGSSVVVSATRVFAAVDDFVLTFDRKSHSLLGTMYLNDSTIVDLAIRGDTIYWLSAAHLGAIDLTSGASRVICPTPDPTISRMNVVDDGTLAYATAASDAVVLLSTKDGSALAHLPVPEECRGGHVDLVAVAADGVTGVLNCVTEAVRGLAFVGPLGSLDKNATRVEHWQGALSAADYDLKDPAVFMIPKDQRALLYYDMSQEYTATFMSDVMVDFAFASF